MKVNYFVTGSGRSPVEEFLLEQSVEIREDFVAASALLEAGRVLSMPLSRNLSSIHPGLHELRLRDRTGQIRVFYYVKRGDAIYMLHAVRKKTLALPKKEIELILRRIQEV